MTQMEELVQQCDMEVMKMAMLRHEETFRQQVHDLHRLYRVQKQLMGTEAQAAPPSAPPCRQVQRRRQHPRRPELSLQLPVDDEEYTVACAGTGRLATPPSREREDELELTLAVGGVNRGGSRSQRRRRESATPSATDCSGRRSPQTPSSSTDSDDALRPMHHHHQRATACDPRGTVMVVKQPQWLVRCLSLRMA